MSLPEKYSAEEWDSIRERFFDSILNETEIAILGQNIGVSWPFHGSDETPKKYIELELEELYEVPGLIGKKSRIHKLMDILRETLAFDDPFSDLVDSVELDGVEDHTFERILAKFNIPNTYPAKLVKFNETTKDLLRPEAPETLLDVIRFGQLMPQDIPEGEELRFFLNGLAHMDEERMARHLPYRRGDRGLYLPEEIGLIVRRLDPGVQAALLKQSGIELTEKELARLSDTAPSLHVEADIKEALESIDNACKWFSEEAMELKAVFSNKTDPSRYFIPIQNPDVERIALALSRIHIGLSEVSGRGGLVSRISGLFKR